MSTPALQSISIECFRGCVEPFKLDFQKGKGITLIYGENGTGKSTICDAFEFLASGHVGSLDNRGLGRTDRFLKTIASKTGVPAVELKCAACRCKVMFRKQSQWTQQSAPGVAGCDKQKPRVLVLRRAQILDLITAQASDRYKAIERFINVQRAETSEAALDGLIRTLRGEQESRLIRLRTSLESLEEALPQKAEVRKDGISWARSEADRDFATEDQLVKANETLANAFQRLGAHLTAWKTRVDAFVAANEGEQLAQKAYEIASQTVSADASSVVQILECAASFLSINPTPTQCPLCESTEKVEGLADRASLLHTTVHGERSTDGGG